MRTELDKEKVKLDENQVQQTKKKICDTKMRKTSLIKLT